MKIRNTFFLLGFTVLSACSTSDLTYESTFNSVDKIRLVESIEKTKISTDSLNSGTLNVLERYFRRHGEGPLDMTVTYDPKDHKKGAAWAAREMARIKGDLANKGLENVDARILPVSGSESATFIRFVSVDALPPEECVDEAIGGLTTTSTDQDRDYPIGCGVKTLFAKQISRKSDLRGRGGIDSANSERISNYIAQLRADPNPQEFISTFALTEVDDDN